MCFHDPYFYYVFVNVKVQPCLQKCDLFFLYILRRFCYVIIFLQVIILFFLKLSYFLLWPFSFASSNWLFLFILISYVIDRYRFHLLIFIFWRLLHVFRWPLLLWHLEMLKFDLPFWKYVCRFLFDTNKMIHIYKHDQILVAYLSSAIDLVWPSNSCCIS